MAPRNSIIVTLEHQRTRRREEGKKNTHTRERRNIEKKEEEKREETAGKNKKKNTKQKYVRSGRRLDPEDNVAGFPRTVSPIERCTHDITILVVIVIRRFGTEILDLVRRSGATMPEYREIRAGIWL